MKKHYLILSILFLFSCNEEKEKIPVNIFTITADILWYEGDSKDWVVAWNSEGELLDFKPLIKKEKLVLTTTGNIIDDKITVALLSTKTFDGVENNYAQVYVDLPVGQEVNRLADIDNSVPAIHSISLNVAGPEDLKSFTMTNRYSFEAASGERNGFTYGILDTRSKDYNFFIRTTNNALRHKFITSVQPDQEINISDSDLKPYDHEIAFDFPSAQSASIWFWGTDQEMSPGVSGYLLDRHAVRDSKTNLTTGYMNGLSKYYVYLALEMPGWPVKNLSYSKRGSVPNGVVNWPDVTKYEIVDKSFLTPVVSGQDIKFFSGYWVGGSPGHNSMIYINSPRLSTKVGKFPDEILKDHPTLDAAGLTHFSADIYTSNSNYLDYVLSQLELQTSVDYEFTYVTLNNYDK